MNFPDDLRYTKDHEWVRIEGDAATIGITEFAQEELGEVVFIELPAVGKNLKKGEAIAVVESTKAASDVYAPITGTVSEVNGALDGEPALVNSSPYGEGWMVKLQNVASSDVDNLMTAADYRKHLGKE